MKKLRWQILIVVLALIAIGVLLISQQPTLLPIAPEVKPATGGVYTEGLVGSFSRLNPVLDFYNPADHDVDRLLYSGLMRFNPRGLPEPDLVESMGISKDGTIYNFSLFPKAVWHDGKPLTSADVLFTVDLLRDDALPIPEDIRALWKSVEVKALDDHTLQFHLPEPYAPFMDYLTFGILPKHLLDGLTPDQLINAPFNLKPVGSGPYRFDHSLSDNGQLTGLVLKGFNDYYRQPPYIEQVVFRYYTDSATALQAYQNGDVQGISQISPDVLPQALQEPNLNLYTGRLPQMTMIFLNLNNASVPFFQDASIRRALLMGLNRQQMINQILSGQAILADGPIFPGSWAYYDGIEHLDYDPEAAKALLKAAGYIIPASGGNVRAKEDQPLAFELLYPDDQEYAALAKAIAQNWQDLGIDVTIKPVAYAEMVSQDLEPRTYQAALVDLSLARSPDPDPYPFWHQAQITGGQNYAQWDDRQASEYLEQARVTTDLNERIRLYHNFQVRFTSEMPSLPLFYPVYTYAVDNAIQGVTMGSLYDTSDRFATITSWYMLAQRASRENPTSTPATTATSP
jgi:peptide/nickel transport system substrate-binding protein